MDLGHDGMWAIAQCLDRAVHDFAIGNRLGLVCSLGGELTDVIAGRERSITRTSENQTTDAEVFGQALDRLAQGKPKRLCHGVEFFGPIDGQGDHVALAVLQQNVVHAMSVLTVEEFNKTHASDGHIGHQEQDCQQHADVVDVATGYLPHAAFGN